MLTRTVWRTQKAGSLDRLHMIEEQLPEPGPGEARVAVKTIGLNFADIFACLGLYSATPDGPFTPGLEYAGIVEAVGPRVTGGARRRPALKNGDRVMGVTRFGAYATHLNIDTRYLHALPRRYNFAEGAALIAQGLTAWYALSTLGAVKAGDCVLVHSAAGGVGLLALDMLSKLKCSAVAVVGRPEKSAFLQEKMGLSPDQIIVRNKSTFGRDLDSALAHVGAPGFNIILDSVAGPYFKPGYDRMTPAGRLVLFGAADFMTVGGRPNYLKLAWKYLTRPKLDPVEMISDNKNLMAFNLIWLWDRIDELNDLLADMMRLKLRPPHIGHEFPFADARKAMDLFQTGVTVGKVILHV